MSMTLRDRLAPAKNGVVAAMTVALFLAALCGATARADYITAINLDNPISDWRLGDAVGSGTALDAKVRMNGAATSVTFGATGALVGSSDKAAQFNGTSSWINIPDTADPTAYTMEMWVKADAGATTSRNLVVRTDNSGATNAWSHQLAITPSGHFGFYLYDQGAPPLSAPKSITGTTTVAANTWYYVAATVANGGAMTLYVNGQQEATLAGIITLWTGADRWQAGVAAQWQNGSINLS
ncbi:MAG: LamG domain-containing protein, partial [Phycisphaerae bacterium]|nr:LamG domain-containing protein [Phycisphaerae bacterium]